MPYLTRVKLDECRNVRGLDIDLSVSTDQNGTNESEPAKFRHLVLTGPNGSGKSGILEALAAHVDSILHQDPQTMPRGSETFWDTHPAYENAADPASSLGLGPLTIWREEGSNLARAAGAGEMIFLYLLAKRQAEQREVVGPSKLEIALEQLRARTQVSPYLLQFLVNKKTEAAFANLDGDRETEARVEAWFATFERSLQRLMEDERLSIEFDRHAFNFVFRRDGYAFDLRTLADGHAAVLNLLAELLIRVDAIREKRKDFTFEPEGVVIVDEIETHLHLSLQEQVLPFLTETFPRFQFLVATHSPAVIASIPNAIVYDLKAQRQVLSDHLRGVPYGTLMTEHFGISSDIDLDSTEKLVRLRALLARSSRGPGEEREIGELSAVLSLRSPTLAVEVWMAKEQLGTSSVHLAERGT
ncbi:MAG: AAA family ATPase [Minicystis sp.]